MQPSQEVVGALQTQEAVERFAAYQWKMMLVAVFLVANVVFLIVILAAPATVVAYIFFVYIVLSAGPKFIFGSVLHRFTGFTRGRAPDPDRYRDQVADEANIGLLKHHSRWQIAARDSDLAGLLGDAPDAASAASAAATQEEGEEEEEETTSSRHHRHSKKHSSKQQRQRQQEQQQHQQQKAVFVSACVTVHHEDEEGLSAGVSSWESTDLPFPPEALQIVFIIDGRRDRAGRLDPAQARSARFLLARLARLVDTGPDDTRRVEDATSVDDDGLVYVESKAVVGPVLMDDGTALYKGLVAGRAGALQYVLVYKARNGGKRHSHQLYFELCHTGVIARPRDGVLFLDSDVKFAWPGSRASLPKLYHGLVDREIIGGACGEIEVWKWMKNPITMTQYFEYKSNQFLAKTGESFFGMVTCLPGAFCMIRPQAMEMVLDKYLAGTVSIFDRNKLDLGEDRTLTTLLLQAGWCTTYVSSAVAKTEAPDTLEKIIRQRRRWINSTIVNMWSLLKTVRRWQALPLIVSLAVELVSSFVLPTAVLMLFYQMGLTMGLNATITVAALVLWAVALVVLSMTSATQGSMWMYEHSAIIGAFVVFLMLLFTIQNIAEMAHKYFMEVVVIFAWLGCVVVASFVHRQASSVVSLIAPFCWFLMAPVMYVVIPIFAICNFDDVSWGTRGG